MNIHVMFLLKCIPPGKASYLRSPGYLTKWRQVKSRLSLIAVTHTLMLIKYSVDSLWLLETPANNGGLAF